MTTLTLDQVLSGADLGLDWGLSDLLLVELSERTVLYGLSRIDGALIELTVHPSGSTAFDDSLSLSGTFQVGIDPSMAWFEGDILISGRTAEDNQIVETNVDGNLSVLASDGALGTLSSAAEAGAYVIAAGQSSDEINVFQKSGQSFVWIDGLADNASTYLQDVADIETFSIGATQYAAVTSSGAIPSCAQVTPSSLMPKRLKTQARLKFNSAMAVSPSQLAQRPNLQKTNRKSLPVHR